MDGFDSRRARRAGLLLCALFAFGYAAQQLAVIGFATPAGPRAGTTAGSTAAAGVEVLAAPAQSALDQILGPHHSVVTASATYTPAITRSGTTYQGRRVAVLSQAVVSGTGYHASTTGNGISSTVTNSTIVGGGIQRLVVAVVVDSRLRPAPRLSAVSSTVAAAMGLQPARGDRLTVISAPIAATGAALPAVSAGPVWSRLVPYSNSLLAAGVSLALLLTTLVDIMLGRYRRRP